MATFGKTDIGDSEWGVGTGTKIGCKFTLSEDGDVTKITAHIKSDDAAQNFAAAIYTDNAGAPNAKLIESALVEVGTDFAWVDFAVVQALTAGVYWLVCGPVYSKSWDIKYDAGAANQACYRYDPAPFSDPFGDPSAYYAREASIYATYTPSGGGISVPVAMHHYGHTINKIIRG